MKESKEERRRKKHTQTQSTQTDRRRTHSHTQLTQMRNRFWWQTRNKYGSRKGNIFFSLLPPRAPFLPVWWYSCVSCCACLSCLCCTEMPTTADAATAVVVVSFFLSLLLFLCVLFRSLVSLSSLTACISFPFSLSLLSLLFGFFLSSFFFGWERVAKTKVHHFFLSFFGSFFSTSCFWGKSTLAEFFLSWKWERKQTNRCLEHV